MIKIDPIPDDSESVLEKCFDGMRESNRELHEAEKANLIAKFASYERSAHLVQLHTYPTETHIGGLTEEKLKSLYSYHLRGKDGDSRDVYDRIMQLGRLKCPYCGLPNLISELDHYLPLSTHPVYSVCPKNLVPSCKNCNQDLKDFKPQRKEDEYFHPYFVDAKFFTKPWVAAEIVWDNKVTPNVAYTILFRAIEIPTWSQIENERARNHFERFKLAKAYEAEANEELSILVEHKKQSATEADFRKLVNDQLTSVSNAQGVNHWKVATYQAVLDCSEFCNADFD